MTAWAVLLLAVSHLVLFGLGARVRGRRRYIAGVAAGLDFAAIEHGLPREAVRPLPRPRRFLIRSDRKPDPEPLVTRSVSPFRR